MGSILVGRIKDKDVKSVAERFANRIKRRSEQEKRAERIALEISARQ